MTDTIQQAAEELTKEIQKLFKCHTTDYGLGYSFGFNESIKIITTALLAARAEGERAGLEKSEKLIEVLKTVKDAIPCDPCMNGLMPKMSSIKYDKLTAAIRLVNDTLYSLKPTGAE